MILGLVGLALIKARYPDKIELRKSFHRIIWGDSELRRIDPDQFASAVLKQSKDVFDKLAEM
jgi:hypothetical protein